MIVVARLAKLCRMISGAVFLNLAASMHVMAQPAPATAVPVQMTAPGFWDLQRHVEKPETGSQRVLHFITEDDYPPFDFIAPDGVLMGFNVELARALCEEMRVQCTVQPRRWDTILDTIAKGEADAAIASIAITPRNLVRVDFTAPYYKTPGRFVGRAGADGIIPLPEMLVGKIIGVEKGTAHEAFLRDLFARAEVRPFDNSAALRSALRRGDIDLMFGDGVTLALWLNGSDAGGCCAFRGGPFASPEYFGDGAGVAVAKGNIALRSSLNYAFRRIAERGVYTELYLKYFPIGFF